MNASVRMVVVLGLIALLSGGALGGLYDVTRETAENNVLKFKKIPAVVDIQQGLTGALDDSARAALEEQLLAEKRMVDIGAEDPLLVFVLSKDGKPAGVAIEDFGQGFGGDLGVMAGFDLATGEILGVGITTMSETPGVGTRVKDETFTKQFRGMKAEGAVKVKKDGGAVDAVSGATISSRAVAAGIDKAKATFASHKDAIAAAVGQ
jgi:electron transport complex protein RnfG